MDVLKEDTRVVGVNKEEGDFQTAKGAAKKRQRSVKPDLCSERHSMEARKQHNVITSVYDGGWF